MILGTARSVAISLENTFNHYESIRPTNSVDLRSCCCKEQLVISDGSETWEVTAVNEGSSDDEIPNWKWKAVKIND